MMPPLLRTRAQHPVVQVCCGQQHTLALLSNGRLLSWGSGLNGRLGNGRLEDNPEPTHVCFPAVCMPHCPTRFGDPSSTLTWLCALFQRVEVVHVCSGAGHNLAISSDGSLYSWGRNFQVR